MKKTAYLWLLLIAFTFAACGGNKAKLIGNWEVAAVNGKASNSKDVATIEFQKADKFVQASGKKSRGGKWELDKDGKTIKLYPDGQKSETMEIVKIEADQLTVKDSRNEFTLKKRK